MEIKTKYNIGDSVYFIHDNRVSYVSIDKILIDTDRESTKIKYGVYPYMGGQIVWCFERQLFSTKEELLKSL